MKYLDVNIRNSKGVVSRYVISNTDYVIKNDMLQSFKVFWPSGDVDSLLLNPKTQPVSKWEGSLSDWAMTGTAATLGFGGAAKLGEIVRPKVAVGAGAAGALGLVIGSVYFKDEIMRLVEKGFWGYLSSEKNESIGAGYYNLETGAASPDFPEAISRGQISVNYASDKLFSK